ncbi:MAG: gliding motility-associated C-terminal domain-containing protein [Lewinella sp.]
MHFLFRFCTLLLLLLPSLLQAQCGLTVNAGPDAFFCPGGSSLQLNGSISGPGLSGFSWSPATGLSDPTVLNPIATVSGPTTYTLTAEVFDPTTNSIINGDFSAGDSDFTTDYSPGSGGAFGLLSDEGEYVVTTNSNLTHTNFGNCPDHTGGGNMMVVNGSATPNENVWCQTVTVAPNITYAFSAWLQSVNPDNPARLQFSVNGSLLGNTFQATSSNCQWREFTETWNSGNSVSATICIVNQNTQPSGNDFAIDDIFFGEVCTQTDEVNLDEVFLDADAVPTADLICDGFGGVSAVLDGSNSSGGPNTFYQWTTSNGNIVSGATTTMPTVDAPGTYLLTTRYDDGITFCTDQVTVVVNPNNGNLPTANAVILSPISCFDNMGVLGIGSSSVGNDFIYDWSTTDGNIVSGGFTEEAVIDQPGIYQLLVTNTISGCSETATVMIEDNRQDPTVSITDPAPLTCNDPMLELDGSGSDGGTGFSASWATADGNILAGENTLSPTVDSAGTYVLTVTNDATGCSATQSVVLTINQPQLTATIATPDTLNCNLLQFRLDGSGSTITPGNTFAWTTTDGNIISDANTANPLIDAPGEYELRVLDAASGCTNTASITVRSAALRPSIALQNPPPFTCGRAQIMLDATASSTGADLSYAWTATNGGGILSDTNTLQPTVMGPGDYTLRVLNNDNGCSRDTTITIGENITPPNADAGTGFTISCSTATDTLDGTASSQGPNFGYEWSTTNGLLVRWTDSLQPIIGRAGTYQLRVLDSINGCSSVAEVTVLEDTNAPAVALATPDTLTCRNPTFTLNATGSDAGTGFTIAWDTNDGSFVTGTDGLSPTIDAPGTYLLTITDDVNGCPSSRSVMVAENVAPPITEAGAPLTLTCRDREGRLLSSDLGPGYSYLWTGSEANPIANADTPSPLVNSDGRYYLEITDNNNGCTAIDSVDVGADQDPPLLAIAPGPAELTCRDTSLSINPGSVPASGISYSWTSADGNISSSDTLPEISVNAPGSYTLLLTNERNGCESDETVLITRDTTLPNVEILTPDTLNCHPDLMETTLNPGNSDAGDPFVFNWTTTDGAIQPGADQNGAVVSQGGTYLLTITNANTGCVDSAGVVVEQDTVRPIAIISEPEELTCNAPTTSLDASASSQGPDIAYAWVTPDGIHLGDQLSVDAGGDYILRVSNTRNRCVAEGDTVLVTDARVLPEVDAGLGGLLTCIDSTIILGGAAGAMDGLSYAWTTISGGTPMATDLPQTTTNQQGTYQLRVSNDSTGCFALDTVEVRANLVAPNAEVPSVRPLNCTVRERTLTAAPPAPGLTYLPTWSTTDGNIVGQADGPSILLDQSGTYRLLLVNPENGCLDSTQVTVDEDVELPRAIINFSSELTCRNMSVNLNAGFSSSGPGFSYQWTTENGTISAGSTTLEPTVTAAGDYLLTVLNENNNCTAEATRSVLQQDQPPALSAGTPSTLTCLVTSVELPAIRGGRGRNFSFSWTTTDGNIVSGSDRLRPVVDQPGTYELTVINTDTDCRASLPVMVSQDITPPTVELGDDFDLGCEDVPVNLTAIASGPAPFSYNWATDGGSLLGSTVPGTTLIQGPGNYAVTVTSQRNGCVASADVLTTQALLLGFDFEQRDPTCRVPLGRVELTDVQGGTPPFLFAVGNQPFIVTPFADSLTSGSYPLVLQDANGCEVRSEATIPNVPVLDLFVDPRSVITLGESHFINTRTNFADSSLTDISWTPMTSLDCGDCLRPTASPTVSTTFTIRVLSSDGCAATDSVEIVVDVLRDVYFPTAFSPTGDGVNDVFLPFGNTDRISMIQDFTVFDRWGASVFNNTDFLPNDPANGWDGRLNGQPMNPAVFVYTATVLFVDGRVEVFKGDVVLTR